MADLTAVKRVYRIFSWLSLAGLAVVILLVLKKPPAPDVPYDPNAAARVQQKFAAADQAKAAGQPAQVQMDRTELNSYLAQNLQLEGSTTPSSATATGAAAGSVPVPPAPGIGGGSTAASQTTSAISSGTPDLSSQLSGADQPSIEQIQSAVKDVKVDMDGDLVKAYVVFDYHGKDLSLELDGHLGSENGYLKFEPVAGKLGSLPLPQSTLDSAVQKMMESPENREKLKLPSDINDVQIVNGNAVVSYK
jgi:hypothetical protein